ncbi:MAG: ribosomal L7Ae/L30e/S12e/Gadd45 family protein [Lachnospiraceae bacterium]|nr:ribosomal L7Ae/L30e/S12e/Gadd45 family protein [Lachnospiraceae bacterium]
MMTDRILSTLSIAMKAGKVSSGETAVLSDIRSFNSFLVLIAGDASDGTKKKFNDKSAFYEVPCYTYGTKDELAHAIGKEERSVISVNDGGFADKIIERLEEADINGKQKD